MSDTQTTRFFFNNVYHKASITCFLQTTKAQGVALNFLGAVYIFLLSVLISGFWLLVVLFGSVAIRGCSCNQSSCKRVLISHHKEQFGRDMPFGVTIGGCSYIWMFL